MAVNHASQILRATRLFYHLDDLSSLGSLTQRECQVLQSALTTLITSLHAAVQREPPDVPTVLPARSYVLLERVDEPTRLLVRVAGEKDRRLVHVPIFCPWGFGSFGYPARDTALAILADFWGETLSRRGFASGQPRYCRDYLAVADLVTRKLRRGGALSTSDLAAFLQKAREAAPNIFNHPHPRENETRGDPTFRLSAPPTIQHQGE